MRKPKDVDRREAAMHSFSSGMQLSIDPEKEEHRFSAFVFRNFNQA